MTVNLQEKIVAEINAYALTCSVCLLVGWLAA